MRTILKDKGKNVSLEFECRDYGVDGPLRFREVICEANFESGEKVEVSLCVSRSAIYLMDKSRQVAIPIRSLIQSVAEFWNME